MGKKGNASPQGKQLKSIGSKIMTADMGVILVVSLVFSILACVMSYKSTQNSLEGAMTAAASATASSVENKIGSYTTYTKGTAATMRLYSDDYKPEEKVALLAQRTEAGKDDGLVGMILCTPDGNDISGGKNYLDSEGFKLTIGGKNYISTPYTDDSGNLVFDLWAPVWQDGKPGTTIVGALRATYSEDALITLIKSITVSKNGAAFAVDKTGTNVLDTNTDRTKSKDNIIANAKTDPSFVSLAALIQKALGGESGFGMYTYGGKKFVAYAPIHGTDGWIICVNAPLSDFMGMVYKTIVISIIFIIIFLFIGAYIVRKMVNTLNVPIGIICERLASFADGDIQTPLPEMKVGSIELNSLADSTRCMVENTSGIIEDIDQILTALANGNLDQKSRDTQMYVGDYNSILRSMVHLRDRLVESFRSILTASDQVSAGSSQVSSGAQTLAQGATEQASSIQELSASIQEVSQQVKENAAAAEAAKSITTSTISIMQGSVEDMGLARQAMDEISSTSKDISKVIKAIDDIAFQTNILALNAAVEAARAGSAGKGFAVVADEVRNLSQKSAEAAKNTTALIEGSITAVEKGTSLVNKTSAGFAGVAEKALKIDELIEAISTQAQQQASAIEQISVGIDQVSSVVQMNSATSEESAAASEELSSQAISLKNLVEQFKLPEE